VAFANEFLLNAADGTSLLVADWPIDDPLGGVVVMHGLGEHSGRYAHVARFFNERGWSVRTYDHRGHGRSGGARGDVPSHDAALQDAKIVIDDFAYRLDAPPLLLGHSMGGLFAASYAVQNLSPLRGLILSSPALRIRLEGRRRMLFNLLRAVAPGLGLPNRLNPHYLSHDPKVARAYRADPLVHRVITARLLQAMLDAIEVSHAQAPKLAVRTLLIVAGDDRLVDAEGSKELFSRLPPGIGTMHFYPDFYHEIFNETGSGRVFDDVRDWLAQT
jgi:alpha-beta hydrolase superfamily lysophospholipase